MGFFSNMVNGIKHGLHSVGASINKFFSAGGHYVHSVANSIGSGISSVAHTAEAATKTAFNTAKGAVATVYSDATGAVKKVFQTTTGFATKVENDIAGEHGIINNTESNIKSLLSWPLILIGGAIIVFAYNSKTTANLSYTK